MPDSERRELQIVKGARGEPEFDKKMRLLTEGLNALEGSPEFLIFQTLVELGVNLEGFQLQETWIVGPVSEYDKRGVNKVWYEVCGREDFDQLSRAFEGTLVINARLGPEDGDAEKEAYLASLIEYASRRAELGISDRIEADRWTDEDIKGMVKVMVGKVIADQDLKFPGSPEFGSD